MGVVWYERESVLSVATERAAVCTFILRFILEKARAVLSVKLEARSFRLRLAVGALARLVVLGLIAPTGPARVRDAAE
jgi:hypothetical protein